MVHCIDIAMIFVTINMITTFPYIPKTLHPRSFPVVDQLCVLSIVCRSVGVWVAHPPVGHKCLVEEHIVVNGQQINKPFLEKPVDRQDRDIYLYLPHAIGGGRAFVSSIESGDD
eukprot:2651799-Amphidinium_carterae.1